MELDLWFTPLTHATDAAWQKFVGKSVKKYLQSVEKSVVESASGSKISADTLSLSISSIADKISWKGQFIPAKSTWIQLLHSEPSSDSSDTQILTPDLIDMILQRAKICVSINEQDQEHLIASLAATHHEGTAAPAPPPRTPPASTVASRRRIEGGFTPLITMPAGTAGSCAAAMTTLPVRLHVDEVPSAGSHIQLALVCLVADSAPHTAPRVQALCDAVIRAARPVLCSTGVDLPITALAMAEQTLTQAPVTSSSVAAMFDHASGAGSSIASAEYAQREQAQHAVVHAVQELTHRLGHTTKRSGVLAKLKRWKAQKKAQALEAAGPAPGATNTTNTTPAASAASSVHFPHTDYDYESSDEYDAADTQSVASLRTHTELTLDPEAQAALPVVCKGILMASLAAAVSMATHADLFLLHGNSRLALHDLTRIVTAAQKDPAIRLPGVNASQVAFAALQYQVQVARESVRQVVHAPISQKVKFHKAVRALVAMTTLVHEQAMPAKRQARAAAGEYMCASPAGPEVQVLPAQREACKVCFTAATPRAHILARINRWHTLSNALPALLLHVPVDGILRALGALLTERHVVIAWRLGQSAAATAAHAMEVSSRESPAMGMLTGLPAASRHFHCAAIVAQCVCALTELVHPLIPACVCLPCVPHAYMDVLDGPMPVIGGVVEMPERLAEAVAQQAVVLELSTGSTYIPVHGAIGVADFEDPDSTEPDMDALLSCQLPYSSELYKTLEDHLVKLHSSDGDGAWEASIACDFALALQQYMSGLILRLFEVDTDKDGHYTSSVTPPAFTESLQSSAAEFSDDDSELSTTESDHGMEFRGDDSDWEEAEDGTPQYTIQFSAHALHHHLRRLLAKCRNRSSSMDLSGRIADSDRHSANVATELREGCGRLLLRRLAHEQASVELPFWRRFLRTQLLQRFMESLVSTWDVLKLYSQRYTANSERTPTGDSASVISEESSVEGSDVELVVSALPAAAASAALSTLPLAEQLEQLRQLPEGLSFDELSDESDEAELRHSRTVWSRQRSSTTTSTSSPAHRQSRSQSLRVGRIVLRSKA